MDRAARLRASWRGASIQRARVELGLTQEQLAAAVVRAGASEGVELTLTASAVSRWESGHFEPALRYRRYLALVLGIAPRALFPIELLLPRRRGTERDPVGALDAPRSVSTSTRYTADDH